MKVKFYTVLLPIVLMIVSTIIVYSFLNWLLIIKLHLLSTDPSYTTTFIPLFISFVISITFIKSKLSILDFNNNSKLTSFYSIIIMLIMTVPLITAQEYIISRTRVIRQLQSIRDINKFPEDSFFHIDSLYFNKLNAKTYTTNTIGDGRGKSFQITIYYTIPISHAPNTAPVAWLGLTYTKKIKGILNEDEQAWATKTFYNDSRWNFTNTRLTEFNYLEKLNTIDAIEYYDKAAKTNYEYKSSQPILITHQRSLDDCMKDEVQIFIWSTIIGSLIIFLMVYIRPLKPVTNT